MSREKRSSFDQRVVWLMAHRDVWCSEADEIKLLKAMVLAMKADGLIAPTSYYRDCRLKRERQAAMLALAISAGREHDKV